MDSTTGRRSDGGSGPRSLAQGPLASRQGSTIMHVEGPPNNQPLPPPIEIHLIMTYCTQPPTIPILAGWLAGLRCLCSRPFLHSTTKSAMWPRRLCSHCPRAQQVQYNLRKYSCQCMRGYASGSDQRALGGIPLSPADHSQLRPRLISRRAAHVVILQWHLGFDWVTGFCEPYSNPSRLNPTTHFCRPIALAGVLSFRLVSVPFKPFASP